MEQEHIESQQPESGQNEALAAGTSAETVLNPAPPQKKGFFSTLISVIRKLLLIPFRHRKHRGFIAVQEVPCITLELVKEYFLRPKTRQLLKSNEKLLAVAIRERGTEGRIVVMLTLYDTRKEEIATDVEAITYRGERLDRELEEAFGDKEMIVLR